MRVLYRRSVKPPSFSNAAACAANWRSSRLQATEINTSEALAAISGKVDEGKPVD
jgi:hypothetical protein